MGQGVPIYSAAMSPLLLPLQMLLLMFAGWVNRRQLDVISAVCLVIGNGR
jgi:hypothetical protein